MIHGQKTKQLGRERKGRNALLKSLAVSLVRDMKIQTTETKAKVLKPIVEKLVTKAKAGDLANKRLITGKIGTAGMKKLVEVIAPKYKDRNGGYLRITKLNARKSDAAGMALIEFV